jgi:hypothetical protein
MCPTFNSALQDARVECIHCRLLYRHDCEHVVGYICISCTALGQPDTNNAILEPDHSKATQKTQSKQTSDTTREKTIEAKERTIHTRDKELLEKERENRLKVKKLRIWEKNLL